MNDIGLLPGNINSLTNLVSVLSFSSSVWTISAAVNPNSCIPSITSHTSHFFFLQYVTD